MKNNIIIGVWDTGIQSDLYEHKKDFVGNSEESYMVFSSPLETIWTSSTLVQCCTSTCNIMDENPHSHIFKHNILETSSDRELFLAFVMLWYKVIEGQKILSPNDESELSTITEFLDIHVAMSIALEKWKEITDNLVLI